MQHFRDETTETCDIHPVYKTCNGHIIIMLLIKGHENHH